MYNPKLKVDLLKDSWTLTGKVYPVKKLCFSKLTEIILNGK